MVYVYVIDDIIRTMEGNVDELLNACLPVNTGKTKYMEVGRH